MTFNPENPVVWTEIPVTDLAASKRFYETVFHWAMSENDQGPNPMVDFGGSGASGHLYPGTPGKGAGPTAHLQVPDTLEAAMERVRAAGGTVLDMPPVSIPPGRFVYALDPDGNSIGLFETAKAA